MRERWNANKGKAKERERAGCKADGSRLIVSRGEEMWFVGS
jgi:hypothetical protein